MCRKSISLTDTPQKLDDHHTKLYLSLCNFLYGKRIKKTTDMLSVYLTTDSGGCALPTSTKLKIKMTMTNHIPRLRMAILTGHSNNAGASQEEREPTYPVCGNGH